jgi:hypothetical protein
MMYGALEWCTQNYSRFVDDLRELCGGSLDLAAGKWETWEPFKNAPKGEPHNIYDVMAALTP